VIAKRNLLGKPCFTSRGRTGGKPFSFRLSVSRQRRTSRLGRCRIRGQVERPLNDPRNRQRFGPLHQRTI
jgi:hypothetical protein